MLHAVVMAGGSGTRFWPQSRRNLPKQFLQISDGQTLIQQTVRRCLPLCGAEQLWVIAGAAYQSLIEQQLPELSPRHLLIEPCARNTAPAIGLAALHLLSVDPEAVMLVVPADHVITPDAAFQAAVPAAIDFIHTHPQGLLLFGATPTFPATGFGYIQRGELVDSRDHGIRHVRAFREKPNLITAQKYLDSDDYYWNCGIFVWRAARILEVMAEVAPDLHTGLQTLQPHIRADGDYRSMQPLFSQLPAISIDYAVLERASQVYVYPANFHWDDVGSWQSLARLRPQDADGNVVDGLHCGINTADCIIRSEPEHLVATLGVKDLIIVHTPQATLIADRRDEEAIRQLLKEIEKSGLDRFL
ncbi:MAG: mannose-1-phosphate guanylyltransferase [Planctomycetaceae bacterium]|nr:MAG: mannose-1-phosphate guanylyltransferase [Planctomycetaceae bacterium]